MRSASAHLPLPRDSVLFRVAAEPVMVLASGPRALLLQVTHPSVAAGVAQHSDYQSRPWVRLFRTLETVVVIAFGPPERSGAAARRLKRRHAEVVGVTDAGSPYRAMDPDLLLWVWATLGESLVSVHERFVRRLAPDERDQLYEEWKLVGYACGMPVGSCPETWADFTAYFDRMVGEALVPTPVAESVVGLTRRPPVPFPLNRAAGAVLSMVTAGQLPERLREELDFSWTPRQERAFRAAASAAQVVARITPGRLRRLPMTLALLAPVPYPMPLPAVRFGGKRSVPGHRAA